MLDIIRQELKLNATSSPERAARFFKTAVGEYSHKQFFIGVPVPSIRKIAKQFSMLKLDILQVLLESNINEEKLLALLILVYQYQSNKEIQVRKQIYEFYLHNINHVDNWNLVDSSAHLIVGAHLIDKDRSILLKLADSENFWIRRISIVATWIFIRKGDLEWTFKISQVLLLDNHDLLQKAVGWMLREAGKKNKTKLVEFLETNATVMPRTMLRYAIEKFEEHERIEYLHKKHKDKYETK